MKTIALIAHDHQKDTLVNFAKRHKNILSKMNIVATGTTASRLEQIGIKNIKAMASGPKGGDLQIGSLIVDGKVDAMIFLWDPLSPQPHDVDVKALLRIAVLKNILLASNLTTAESIISEIAKL
jgi:methylglyoxal synthase